MPRSQPDASLSIATLSADAGAAIGRARPARVVWVEDMDGWLVIDRALAVEVLRDPDTFTVDDPRFTTAQVVGPSMLSLDGPEHRRHRSPFVAPYKRAALAPLEDWLTDEARRLVDGMAPAGSAELRTALAAPLATATIHRSLGFVDTDPTTMLAWYRAIAAGVADLSAGLPAQPAAAAAMTELRAAVARTVAGDPTSMLARLATTELSADELAQNAAVVLFGAIETAEGMTATALWHLLTHPDQLDLVRRDRTLVAAAVEESLRVEPAAAAVDRYTTRAVQLGGASVDERDLVRVSLTGANRDPAVFDRPDEFDLTRRDSRLHLAFASGPHLCIGLLLARMETAAAIEAVLDLLPGITVDAATSTPPSGFIFRKPGRVNAHWGG